MVASYPTTVRDYSARTDLVDIVVADNVNSLQEEVRAIETALGVSTTGTSPLVSTFSGTWSSATTAWGTLGARLLNIEAGLVSGLGANSPYVIKTGGSQVLTATNVGLSLKTGTGTLALLETYTSANVLGFNVTYLGIPRVGTNNVLYVNSSEYNSLVSGSLGTLGYGTNGQVLTTTGSAAYWSTPVSSYVGQTNGVVTTASTSSGVVRNIWTSTSSTPTGGIDGDIWIVYV
jgi:hypothetical protein